MLSSFDRWLTREPGRECKAYGCAEPATHERYCEDHYLDLADIEYEEARDRKLEEECDA